MQGNRKRDTKPELRLRRWLHAAGFRYRVAVPIRTPHRLVRPDIVFTRARLAVFVDGCFWHGCPTHGVQPRTHVDYWTAKLTGNVERDRRVDAALVEDGWTVLRCWEHDDPAIIGARVAAVLASRVGDTGPGAPGPDQDGSEARVSAGRVTAEDLERTAEVFADLDDPDLMRGAWE